MLWERLLPQEAANFLRPTTQPTPAHSAAPTKPTNYSSVHQLQVQLLRRAAELCQVLYLVCRHRAQSESSDSVLWKRLSLQKTPNVQSSFASLQWNFVKSLAHYSRSCIVHNATRERCLHETTLNAQRVGLRLNHWLPLSCIALICIFLHLCDRSVLLYRSLQNSGRVVTEKPAVPVSPPWCPNQPIRMIITPPILILLEKDISVSFCALPHFRVLTLV